MIAAALCSLLRVPTAIFLFASPRNFMPAIADSVYVKMTLNFLFKNLDMIPFLLCPPSPLILTA